LHFRHRCGGCRYGRARVSLQSVAGETLLALLIVVRMGGMGTRLLPSRGRGGWQP
jgi:hypothetical protein